MDIKENMEPVVFTVEECDMLSEVIEDIVFKNDGEYGINQVGVLIDAYRKLEYPEDYNKEFCSLYVDGDVYKQNKSDFVDVNKTNDTDFATIDTNDAINKQRYKVSTQLYSSGTDKITSK